MFVFVISVFIIALAFYLYLTWDFDYWRRRRVTGPVPRAYLGTFPKTALFEKNSNYIQECTEIYKFVYLRYFQIENFNLHKLDYFYMTVR